MTTIWRPHVRIEVPNVGDAENTDTSRDELTKKGTKRKSPALRAVRARGEVLARSARCAALVRTVVSALMCKECGGASICEHGRRRTQCKECGGASICEHGRERYECKECGGKGICEHGRERSQCKECGGSGICEHGRQRSCLQGVRWCIHMRARSSALVTARSAVGQESASTVVGALSARSVKAHACDTTSATQQTAMMEAF